MKLKLKEAVRRAEKTKEAEKLRKENYFLNSGISIIEPRQAIDKWILTYYNPDENKVVEVIVSQDFIDFKEAGIPVNPTKNELDVQKIKTSSEKILEKAGKEFLKYKQPLSQIILSIQNEGRHVWRISFITKLLYVVTVKLDAEDGRIISSEIKSLVK